LILPDQQKQCLFCVFGAILSPNLFDHPIQGGKTLEYLRFFVRMTQMTHGAFDCDKPPAQGVGSRNRAHICRLTRTLPRFDSFLKTD